ncbi:MAG: hypothetical protein N3D84_03280, partial [Candidatus Woesearchaeota archaeon]|nr:hypothetical protein [Candidatus Woesearchaeota archaeon]
MASNIITELSIPAVVENNQPEQHFNGYSIYRPDLCEHFSKKMEALPYKITPSSLDEYADFILKYPYL